MSKCRDDDQCQEALDLGLEFAHCKPGYCLHPTGCPRPQHQDAPADSGTHPHNDGLDDYREPKK